MKTDQDNIEAEIGRIEAHIDEAKKALEDDSVSQREMAITVVVFAIVIAAMIYLYHRLFPHLYGDSLQTITWFTLAVAAFGFWISWKIRCRADMRKMQQEERLLGEHLANKRSPYGEPASRQLLTHLPRHGFPCGSPPVKRDVPRPCTRRWAAVRVYQWL